LRSDGIENSAVDVIIWVPRDRDSACAGLMAELAVTSTHAAQCPSAVFEHPNHVAYLHHGPVLKNGKAALLRRPCEIVSPT